MKSNRPKMSGKKGPAAAGPALASKLARDGSGATSSQPDEGGSVPMWRAKLRVHLLATLRCHTAILTLVIVMFFARWLMSDWHSYWYDELLSVDVYGNWHDSSGAALSFLGDRSIHPPLYQLVLYHWMSTFGTGEVATRSLSNLFIAGSTIIVYLITKDFIGKRALALSAAGIFSALYVPLYYALETRSYAQSVFLTTLSAYAMLRLLPLLRERVSTKQLLRSGASWLLILVNAGLLLTHYFNGFFILSQAIVVTLYALWHSSRAIMNRFIPVLILYGVSSVVFLAAWGRQALHQVGQQSDRLVDGPPSPIEILSSTVVQQHLTGPAWIAAMGLLAFGMLGLRELYKSAVEAPGSAAHLRAWATVYLMSWLALPPVVMSGTFLAIGGSHYDDRYFSYLATPLAILLAVIVSEVVRWVRVRTNSGTWASSMQLILAVVVLLTILPQSRMAVSERRYDWRSLAEQVVTIVESNPDHTYLIYQSGFRAVPLMNHYFERLHPDIRVHGTITRGEQGREGPMRVEQALQEGDPNDFLIVMFPHIVAGDYSIALERLDSEYPRHHTQIDDRGRGWMMFRTGSRDLP